MTNCNDIINITYKCEPNLNRTYFQNQNRYVKVKTFTDVEEAKAFAQNVEVIHIWNGCGKKITL